MKQNRNKIILGLVVILTLTIYSIYNDNRYANLISKNTSKARGFLSHSGSSSKTGPYSIFVYYVGGQAIEHQVAGDYTFLQKGDTVLIKYSNEDPSVAKVIDFYYMKKFKNTK